MASFFLKKFAGNRGSPSFAQGYGGQAADKTDEFGDWASDVGQRIFLSVTTLLLFLRVRLERVAGCVSRGDPRFAPLREAPVVECVVINALEMRLCRPIFGPSAMGIVPRTAGRSTLAPREQVDDPLPVFGLRAQTGNNWILSDVVNLCGKLFATLIVS